MDAEQLELECGGAKSRRFKLVVHNGDDPPLQVARVRPQSVERRVYFDPRGRGALRLYCGDDRARAPEYDYGKAFQLHPDAARAELGPEQANAAFTGRPDERPWSERYPAVLWTALVIAVAGLGALALRGLMRA